MDRDKEGKDVTEVKGHIEFRNVWFRYPTRKEDFVLKGLNLEIKPNESVALVGESGCGKSTFVNLMMRFYDPDAGEILLDGVNLKDYNLHALRNTISLVMQEPIIFNYTILDNMLYGKLQASNSEVYKSAAMANCNDFIEQQKEREVVKLEDEPPAELMNKLLANQAAIEVLIGDEKFKEELDLLKKMDEIEQKKGKFLYMEGDIDMREDGLRTPELHEGYSVLCGLKGSKLSGGQKQRVAIARTIMRQPSVLMLDEATSALDEDAQKKVQQALETASANRTTIIIAHRMSTIEKCDKIFVLESGTLKEEGAFNELKTKGGAFTKLSVNKQN